MESFLVYIGDISNDLGSSISVTEDLILGKFSFNKMSFEHERPSRLEATLTNVGSGIVATGSVLATLRTECCRCLEPFAFEVEGAVEAFFATPDHSDSLPADQEWEPIQGESVDLLPGITSAILIEVPIAPVHDEGCMGICPQCGCNLNANRCECLTVSPNEGPFESLGSMLKDTD